ncbi:hypothetical protein [Proteiniborus sp. MB09-C3]|uniref:hypothetical protein n=1 Tax=Proteiniborus sp. MB09-C3 TaxID=3050072 RepID=UPI002552B96F|nr:hypothetical protein [Proteiniborus sp. MB09-C3]WIV13982.1 hypothetical protein QO263_04170 [Proteiniborus sp. MB09-C3]
MKYIRASPLHKHLLGNTWHIIKKIKLIGLGVCYLPKTYQDTVGALCVGDEKGNGNQYVSQNIIRLKRK